VVRARRPNHLDPAALVDRWFRALDQQKLRVGMRDWLVQVTGIHVEDGVVWIQISDGLRRAGSVLLCVASNTSVTQAVRALTLRERDAEAATSHPVVINAHSSAASIARARQEALFH